MIEAELKARLRDPDAVRARLDELAAGETVVYRDTYYDQPDCAFMQSGRELRIRVIETPARIGLRTVLTYKDPAVDESGSKPEFETAVADAAMMGQIVERLGYSPRLAFTKHCANYRFRAAGRDILVTLVTVPEVDGSFLEVETQAHQDELAPALETVRKVLNDLGVTDDELTTELYSDAVRASRSGR